MVEAVPAPVSREQFQSWIDNRDLGFLDIRQGDDALMICHDVVLPEITVLFASGAEEICGMYDRRSHEFRFVTDPLATVIDGLSEAERWPGNHTSEEVYAKISSYSQDAVKQKGYRFKNARSAEYVETLECMSATLSALRDCAAMFSAQGRGDSVLDIRDLAEMMIYFWPEPVYMTYTKGSEGVVQKYLEEFDQTVSSAVKARQAPMLSPEQAESIFHGLAIHAEEVVQNEDDFTLWECCHLAKRLAGYFPEQCQRFSGDFTPDYSERFTKFGSQDQGTLEAGKLWGKPVLVYNHPVSDGQIPEGWRSYHLSGRNIFHPDLLSKTAPEKNYLGTVVSPYVLIRASYQSRQIREPFRISAQFDDLYEFCEKNNLPQPEQTAAPQIEMEMSL